MATVIGNMAVGSIVKIKINDKAYDFIIVHQGNPDTSMYDSSCDGTWVLMKDCYTERMWDISDSDYKNSDILAYLNGRFLDSFGNSTKSAIKQVKIPYYNGPGSSGSISSGANGLSTKIFLLSGYEVGVTQSGVSQAESQYFPIDGAKLSFFSSGTDASANNKRIANYRGSATSWWLRSPETSTSGIIWTVLSKGSLDYKPHTSAWSVRPAFILPTTAPVDSNGNIVYNTAPTISGSSSSGSNLGEKSAPFNFTYTVRDADNDSVTVREYLDNVLQRSYTASLGATNTFQATSDPTKFQSLSYASHTIKVVATDSEGASSADYVVYFTKVNTAPTITSDKTGDLGTLEDGFICNYSVDDADASDSVNVSLSMDDTQISTFEAVKGQQYTYSLTGADWLKITNGSHTFKISASDGKDTAESAATFTRNCTALSTTLSAPLPADDNIVACTLKVAGSIPADAVCKYEVTNNANDPEPVWEDCTEKTKAGLSFIFTNKTAVNGFAFNFRISIERGASGEGGYITEVSGGFE